jgi:type I restriction enzyme S subunit
MVLAGPAPDDVTNFAIPFPPLAEQHRIVAEVDLLMALCDDLEDKLFRTQFVSDSLLFSTADQLLNRTTPSL